MKAFLSTLNPILIRLLVVAISMSMGYKLSEWYYGEYYKEIIKLELKKERDISTSKTFF
jgi:hypothetical protein